MNRLHIRVNALIVILLFIGSAVGISAKTNKNTQVFIEDSELVLLAKLQQKKISSLESTDERRFYYSTKDVGQLLQAYKLEYICSKSLGNLNNYYLPSDLEDNICDEDSSLVVKIKNNKTIDRLFLIDLIKAQRSFLIESGDKFKKYPSLKANDNVQQKIREASKEIYTALYQKNIKISIQNPIIVTHGEFTFLGLINTGNNMNVCEDVIRKSHGKQVDKLEKLFPLLNFTGYYSELISCGVTEDNAFVILGTINHHNVNPNIE
jgi:hypothetical protein